MSPTKKNAVANYVNFAVLALLNLALAPLFAAYLGAANFGLWKVCLRLLDFAAVADGRTTQALKWVIAFRSGDSDVERKRRDLGASLLIWLLWLPVLLAVLALAVYTLPLLVSGVTARQAEMIRVVAIILGLNVVLTALLGMPAAVLAGLNRGYQATHVATIFLIASNAAMLLAAGSGYGLAALATIMVISSVLSGVVTWSIAIRTIDWWGIQKPTREDIRDLSGFSGWTLIWSFLQLLLLSTELLLIGYALGAVAIAAYTFTAYAVQFALAVCLMTASAIMPRLGSVLGSGDKAGAGVLARQTREIVLALATISGAVVLLFNRPFVALWAGPQMYLGDVLNALIVATFFQLALIRCEGQIQDVGLVIRSKVLIGSIAAILGLLLGWAGYAFTGGLEYAFVGIILGRLVATAVFPLLVNRLVVGADFPAARYATAVAVLTLTYLVGRHVDIQSWVGLAAWGGATSASLSAAAAWLLLSPETRLRIYSFRPNKGL